MVEICLKLAIRTQEWHQLHLSVVFIFNFEQNLHIALFVLWTLNKLIPAELLVNRWTSKSHL